MSSPASTGPSLTPYPDQTLNELFLSAVQRFGRLPALGRATSAARLSYSDVEAGVARLAGFLQTRGIERGDRIAILSESRPEWAIVDYAVLAIGGVTVPVYPTLPASQVAEILDDCEARIVFVSTAEQARKIDPAHSGREVIILDNWAETLANAVPSEGFRENARTVAPGDLATLIYTSGTTGTPKGVMLTHGNMAAMVAATGQHGSLKTEPGDVALSILPLSHVFERAASYYFFAQGTTIVYAESMQTVARDLTLVRPHHVVAVPRLFEKVYQAVVSAPAIKGKIARWAARTADAFATVTTRGHQASLALRARHAVADRLVYRVLRERVGGRLKTFICGGAPLDARIGALFLAAGLPVYEGYGLTETSPVISANKPGAVRLGSAGVPYPGVEVRLGQSDEIQVRGASVTPGYWGRPDATTAAFTADGWFRTGDVGAFRDGFLFVVDRIKDIIVTAAGKNVAPQPIEQRLVASPLISQAVILGDRRPYPIVLVVPDFDALLGAAKSRLATGEHPNRQALADDETLQAVLAAEVAASMDGIARVDRPKRMAILPEELTVDEGLMTPTLKIRRRAVEARYAQLIELIYSLEVGIAVP